MSKLFRVGVFQFSPIWEEINQNRLRVEQLLQGLSSMPNLIVFPEMYNTGFCLNPHHLDKNFIQSQQKWQEGLTERFSIAIAGSLLTQEGDAFFNRLIISQPNSETKTYDKRHLFFGEKNKHFKHGEERVVVDVEGIKIMPQVCYDLRFPVWSRNNLGYDILIYSANWPSERIYAWDTLLKARAIENQCYVIGVNRIGEDGNNIKYNGHSVVIDSLGKEMLFIDNKESYSEIELPIDELQQFRKSYPFLNDQDEFEVK